MEVPENVDEEQAYENWGYVQEGMNPYVNNPKYAGQFGSKKNKYFC